MPKRLKFVVEQWVLFMVRRQTWQALRFEIFESARHFRIEFNRDVRFEFESNLESSQVPSWILCITYVALIFLRKTIAYVACVRLLQKLPYVVAVVEFCVYLIHLSLWYCKSRQRSFVRFLVLCFSWSQKVALCFIALLFSLCGGIAAGVQTVNCEHAWSRFSGVSYGTLTHSSHWVKR